MEVRKELYVGGRWAAPEHSDEITVVDSSTEEPMGSVPRGGAADVEQAVAAARSAFPAWSATSTAERVAALTAIADGLEARTDELAELMSREVGTPISTSRRVQVGLAVDVFRSIAEVLADFPLEERLASSLVIRQPAGVVAAITPWNYPLYQLAAKLAPALGAGCTTILKPAGVAPLAAFALAEVIDGLGLPPGTVNVVSGPGREIGELMAGHPGVDMVSITGSTAAGIRVAEAAAKTVKRVTLELGGKSPFVLLEDADLAAALPVAVRSCFVNNGQTCAALTRLIVPRARLAEVADGLGDLVGAMRVGDPLDPATELGPMVSAGQRETVRGYIGQGRAEGATLVTGGDDVPDGLERGFYVRPTVFSDVTPDMVVAREEIFGPVLTVLGYDSEDDAVEIANDSDYGLSGGVWAADEERATAVARRLRTGQVAVNGGRFNVRAPFGGYKQSGVGRELGGHGLAEYFELTSLQLPARSVTAALAAEDELAIRGLLARYGDAVCRRDPQAWIATWAPDCTWDLGRGRVTHGHDETLALWRTAIDKYPWVAQVPASGFVESVGGETRGTWYVLELNHRSDGTGVMHLGHYRDTYVKSDDGWRFATRRFHLIYRGAMDSGTVKPLEEE